MKRTKYSTRKPGQKTGITDSKGPAATAPLELREFAGVPAYTPPESMVRTQIYLTRVEHDFLMGEGNRRSLPMAAIIREYIDEKMAIPEDAWLNNPLAQPAVDDPGFSGHEDGAINHDHYIHGTPKRFHKVRGKWVPQPAGAA